MIIFLTSISNKLEKNNLQLNYSFDPRLKLNKFSKQKFNFSINYNYFLVKIILMNMTWPLGIIRTKSIVSLTKISVIDNMKSCVSDNLSNMYILNTILNVKII